MEGLVGRRAAVPHARLRAHAPPARAVELLGGTTFHFVTDGIEAAVERAREAAGDRDVSIGGGASTVRQYLRAGLVDQMRIHVTPVLLGAGERLFEDARDALAQFECVELVSSPAAAHFTYQRRE